jgi:energy-converting hydrogenase Eha subunit E
MTMTEFTNGKPALLIKKLGAMLFLIVGALLTATGYAVGPNWLRVLGIALLAVGVALLVLKILRRNEVSS